MTSLRRPIRGVINSNGHCSASGLRVLLLVFQLLALALVVTAQGLTAGIKGTVSATTSDPAAKPARLAGAHVSLVNKDLNSAPIKTVTDESGGFTFLDLPAGNYLLTAEADGQPSVKRDLSVTAGATLVVEVVLTASLSESVTVRDEEGLLSTGETSTSNTVRAEKLEELPLRAENYQSAQAMTPGIVRGLDGLDHIKGTSAGENSYTVNGADVTDPVSGNLAFDIPLEAAAAVQVEENPYSAEYGKFRGGSTNLETRSGGDKFKVRASRFFPTFRNIIGGKIDSFRPRVTFEGPLVRNRLNFLQSFEYRFSRTRVPSLPSPFDDSTAEAFNSFTQLDLTVNDRNRLKFVAAVFPEKMRFVGLNTFNPQPTTANTKQRGELVSVSEQAIFHDESFLSSLLSYKTFRFDVFGQGLAPFTVLPDGNQGNYFADSMHSAGRWQWQEQYFARPRQFFGEHSIKLGAEVDYTQMSGAFNFRSIMIRRHDQTLSQRVDFTGPKGLSRPLTEFGAFAQDRWALNKSLTLDLGLRLDRNSISQRNNLAPRASLLYLPFKNDRTAVRVGVGLFYDRSPLSSRYFDLGELDDEDDPFGLPVLGIASPSHYPERIVTTFAADGITVVDGPRRFENVIRRPLRDARSTRWSLQVDQQLTRHLTARVGYLQRWTVNEPIIVPHLTRGGGGSLVLKSRGRSAYDEVQAVAIYNSPRFHNWNLSYVWSRAHGHLNTADNFLGNFPALVARANEYGPLPFDVPHRFLGYGEIKAPFALTVMPSLEIHTGFPFSIVNERLDFVGPRNQHRYPAFLSLDATVLKSFKIPFFDKRARAGVVIFNITNHFNPRDVQNNTGSLRLGQFFNSLGPSVRGKFEMDF